MTRVRTLYRGHDILSSFHYCVRVWMEIGPGCDDVLSGYHGSGSFDDQGTYSYIDTTLILPFLSKWKLALVADF